MVTKRLDYLDAVKGFAIILVIIGHIYQQNSLTKWIYSFHMPLFFIVTGMLLKYKNSEELSLRKICRKKIRSLMIPYINLSVLVIILNYIIFATIGESKTNVLYTITLFGVGSLWFLPALFIAEILFFISRKYLKNEKIRIALIGLLFILTVIFGSEVNKWLWVVPRSIVGLGFISLGYYAFKFLNKLKSKNTYIVILAILSIILSQVSECSSIWNLSFDNLFIYMLNAIVGSTLIILLFKKINIKTYYFGVNSLVLMATHQTVIQGIVRFLPGWPYEGYIIGGIVLLLTIIIEIPIIYVINTYVPWMLGKFKKKEKMESGAISKVAKLIRSN